MKVLLTGWFSFEDGEATAGDVLALHRVRAALDRTATPYDVAWSPGYRAGGLHLPEAAEDAYSHLVLLCGPLHGPQVEELHRRFGRCVRIAVGTSVIDASSPAVTGFHTVLARDSPGLPPARDLAAGAPAGPATPVVGVILTHGQGEYGGRRRHAEVADTVTRWLAAKDCARLEMTSRLDPTTGACARPRGSSSRLWRGSTWWSPTGCTGWSSPCGRAPRRWPSIPSRAARRSPPRRGPVAGRPRSAPSGWTPPNSTGGGHGV
ncbi:hypothetical protein GCM10010246_21470 [Streptomyces cuspidosporus]|uniref:Polysaccharide pyruvyl transferase domain-containing protein n=1 Tax=Streptomyces cuspidosporus TaxID=66882 RepID=A0ABN3FT26_9ACTN